MSRDNETCELHDNRSILLLAVVGGYANSAATKATPSVGKKDLMFMKCIVANVLLSANRYSLGYGTRVRTLVVRFLLLIKRRDSSNKQQMAGIIIDGVEV